MRRGQQTINEARVCRIPAAARRVRHDLVDLLGRWRQTDEIERRPADECLERRFPRWGQPFFLQPREDESIDWGARPGLVPNGRQRNPRWLFVRPVLLRLVAVGRHRVGRVRPYRALVDPHPGQSRRRCPRLSSPPPAGPAAARSSSSWGRGTRSSGFEESAECRGRSRSAGRPTEGPASALEASSMSAPRCTP